MIVQNNKVLLVQEIPEMWWAFPGGGIDHGETIQASVAREISEELGVSVAEVSSDFQIAYYNIGTVVNGVPRMNLYYKVTVPAASLRTTNQVAKWEWFGKDDFMETDLNLSYDKDALAKVIFGS
jgi:8-oxo-dGTP pyrophosphatase MutT (NUDIX family)